ncbi:MAG: hypothetical protein OXE94_05810 [Aestuariivita sp.]|nr:hypothetical protein [Aestuariivita sp.]MCY4203649.1 hypothetical protein [Aestuariivita sp.]
MSRFPLSFPIDSLTHSSYVEIQKEARSDLTEGVLKAAFTEFDGVAVVVMKRVDGQANDEILAPPLLNGYRICLTCYRYPERYGGVLCAEEQLSGHRREIFTGFRLYATAMQEQLASAGCPQDQDFCGTSFGDRELDVVITSDLGICFL